MMIAAPNASNQDQSFASPHSSDEKILLSASQSKMVDNPGPLTAPQPVASSSIVADVNDYTPDAVDEGDDALKIFNESLKHSNSKETHLSAMSELTSELGCILNEDWSTGSPSRKPAAPRSKKRDDTDHLATIIELKMDLAQAHAKNDQLLLLLRQCMTEKMELESKLRASLPSSSMQTKREPAQNYHQSFHAPPSYKSLSEPAHNHHHSFHTSPRQHNEHVVSTPKPTAWREETLYTNAHHTKTDYVSKLMARKIGNGGVRVVNH